MSGSQADQADKNKVTLLKLSELQKTQSSAGSCDSDAVNYVDLKQQFYSTDLLILILVYFLYNTRRL